MVVLEGVIERITFFNEENDYTVARLKQPSGTLISIVGEMPQVYLGEELRVTGEWVSHKEYGRQFHVVEREVIEPNSLLGIERFLGSGLVKGVGKTTAKKLVAHFKEATLDVINNDPQLLAELPGISLKKAKKISANLQSYREIERIIVFLHGLGVGSSYAMKIYRQYGENSIQKVKENPYLLADQIFGIGFKIADQIAHNVGITDDSPFRIQAGISYVLNEICNNGHVFAYEEELLKLAAEELRVTSLQVAAELETLIVTNTLIRAVENEKSLIYLPLFYYSEVGAAQRLYDLATFEDLELLRVDAEKELAAFSRINDIELAAQQRKAVLQIIDSGVSVITGGPGTGKTTIIKAALHLLQQAGIETALAAPTGRAAKRLAEATGEPAKTVHRLLGFGAGSKSFQVNEDDPLDVGAVIVDEFSMVDLLLFNNLLKALLPGTRLIIVGDVDQLPSVGAGSVLRDLIGSGTVSAVRLEVIFRQAQKSLIIENAHRINAGEFPLLTQNKDFYFIAQEDPAAVLELLPDLLRRRIPGFIDCDPFEDIQVLSPMRRTSTGVDSLNVLLQEALNPPDKKKPELKRGLTVFRLGDKVMQLRNNYDKDVFNGDMGRIKSVDDDDHLEVVYPDGLTEKVVEYDDDELDQLVLAYATTVHKSQGNEYPVVIIPVLTQHYMMLQRNLLYTAVTRAKRMVVLIGNKRAIGMAVSNNRIEKRNSLLAIRLQRQFEE